MSSSDNTPNAPFTIKEVLILTILIVAITTAVLSGLNYLNDFYWHYSITGNTWAILIGYTIQIMIMILGIYYLSKIKHKVSLYTLGFRPIKLFETLGYVFFGYFSYIFLAATFLIVESSYQLNLPGFSQQESYIAIFGNNKFGLAALAIIAIIVAPVIEEILFRGIALNTMRNKIGTAPAIFISAFLFALFHFQPSSIGLLLLLGIIMGWIYHKSNSIWPAILFHALNNGIALIFQYMLENHLLNL